MGQKGPQFLHNFPYVDALHARQYFSGKCWSGLVKVYGHRDKNLALMLKNFAGELAN